MAEQKQGDQLEDNYSSSVRIRDVALKTCQRRLTIGRNGEKGSGISMLAVRHDDDEEWYFLTHRWEDKGVYNFAKVFYRKMIVRGRHEFEQVYFYSTVQHFYHYTAGTHIVIPENLIKISILISIVYAFSNIYDLWIIYLEYMKHSQDKYQLKIW